MSTRTKVYMLLEGVTHAPDCSRYTHHYDYRYWYGAHVCSCMPARVLHARGDRIKVQLRRVAFGVGGAALGVPLGYWTGQWFIRLTL